MTLSLSNRNRECRLTIANLHFHADHDSLSGYGPITAVPHGTILIHRYDSKTMDTKNI